MNRQVSTDKDSLREKTLEVTKRHKASWVELGQYLYSIYHDKMYKDWGFLSFEAYCWKELRLKQPTAMKLLKSYYFLEKEEPKFLNEASSPETAPREIPNYESVNLLRLAKENKSVTESDYRDLREVVIEKASEPKEVRAQVKKIIAEQEEEKNPAEVRKSRRNSAIKRLITVLASAKRQLASENLIPEHLVKQIDALTAKLEDQLE
ncbi:MAG: hypothetical protein HZC17_04190 [Candidatus Omnitrophica bacterium]|nr:hypothetical protein [Candidatus Omnitrophota bacterium]